MAAAAVEPGEAVLHVGCGTGYFTAVLAALTGATGHVLGLDIEAALARVAAENLAPWPQAAARPGDGSSLDRDYDVIYVNAGATHARPEWLRALRRGGRMILPLTKRIPMFPSHGVGVVTCITHPTPSDTRWPLAIISGVGMFDCANAREPETEMQLRALLGLDHATALVLDIAPHARGAACLVHHATSCIQRA
jgi:protein-L-isoaspartate(D-aspartate) O-methyltransferase